MLKTHNINKLYRTDLVEPHALRHISLAAALAAACLLLAATVCVAAAERSSTISYRISPVLQNGGLAALDVQITVPGSASGTDVLVRPEELDSDSVVGLSAQKGQLTDLGGGRYRITHAPGEPFAISYRIQALQPADPQQEPRHPVIRPTWFVVRGDQGLLVPEGQAHARVRLTLGPFPSGWTVASSINGDAALEDAGDCVLIGGADYRLVTRQVSGAPLRMAYPAQLEPLAATLLDHSVRVLGAERTFWKAPSAPFLVAVVPLTDDSELGGRGLQGGFELFLGHKAPASEWLHLIAHENLHTWISRRIGGFPAVDSDLEAWLNEGFTEALTAKVLLDAGLWTVTDFLADQNKALLGYAASPLKTAPNSRILADRMRDFDASRLPYDRGRLLALLWDYELRAKTGGRTGLVEVLRAQEHEASRVGMSADRLFPVMVKRLTGLDWAGEIARYVDRGEAIELPEDLLGSCARVAWANQPVFDRGFNIGATVKAGNHLQELEPGGPAARAGLKEGDHILIDEIPTHDSRVTLTYRVVEADGSRRKVSYSPEGAELVRFQQIELTDLAAQEPARCAGLMARP